MTDEMEVLDTVTAVREDEKEKMQERIDELEAILLEVSNLDMRDAFQEAPYQSEADAADACGVYLRSKLSFSTDKILVAEPDLNNLSRALEDAKMVKDPDHAAEVVGSALEAFLTKYEIPVD